MPAGSSRAWSGWRNITVLGALERVGDYWVLKIQNLEVLTDLGGGGPSFSCVKSDPPGWIQKLLEFWVPSGRVRGYWSSTALARLTGIENVFERVYSMKPFLPPHLVSCRAHFSFLVLASWASDQDSHTGTHSQKGLSLGSNAAGATLKLLGSLALNFCFMNNI